MIDNSSDLVGTWQQVSPAEPVTVCFKEDGSLVYVVHREDGQQVIKLLYETVNGLIITDQPSQPGTERTEFSVSPDGLLTLIYDGETTVFRRAESCEVLP